MANPGRTDHGRRFPVSVDLCPVDLYAPRSPVARLPVTRAGPPPGGPVRSTPERTISGVRLPPESRRGWANTSPGLGHCQWPPQGPLGPHAVRRHVVAAIKTVITIAINLSFQIKFKQITGG